jgi:hypothetical protein
MCRLMMVVVETPPEQHLVMSFPFHQLSLIPFLLSLLTEGDYSAPCSWGSLPDALALCNLWKVKGIY